MSRYDLKLRPVQSNFAPENPRYHEGVVTTGVPFAILGLVLLLTESMFILIIHVLKFKRQKKLSKLRKKYNRRQKVGLVSMYLLCSFVGFICCCVSTIGLLLILKDDYIFRSSMQLDLARMEDLAHTVDAQSFRLCNSPLFY